MKVPATRDILQEKQKLDIPEIRVWCHPHKIGKTGSDYHEVFNTFKEALDFIKNHKEAEEVPLIAFRGYELNIFTIRSRKKLNK